MYSTCSTHDHALYSGVCVILRSVRYTQECALYSGVCVILRSVRYTQECALYSGVCVILRSVRYTQECALYSGVCHESSIRPPMSVTLARDTFYKAFATLALQATNTAVRRPGNEASIKCTCNYVPSSPARMLPLRYYSPLMLVA